MFLGWTSPITPRLLDHDFSFKITANEACWTVCVFTLGMACGCFLSIFLLDIVGRKVLILLTIFPSSVSWMLMLWSPSISNLYVSRFIGGTASGIIFTSGSIYVTEISPPHIRSALCSCFLLMNYCGSFLGYVLTSIGTIEKYSYVGMFLVMLQFIVFAWMPESPFYLLRRKRFGAGMDSLMYMRNSADVAEELDSIMKSVESDSQYNGTISSIFHLASEKGGKRVILIGANLMTLQVFSGTIILITYSRTIFEKIDNVQLPGTYISIVLPIVFLMSYLLCISLVDRLGRKPLIIVSTVGVASCSFLLGIYFFLEQKNLDTSGFQPFAFGVALLYVISVSLGLASVPFVVMNEIFPMYAKAACVGLGFCVNFIWSFIILRIWSTVVFANSIHIGFWLFSGFNVFSIFFLVFYLPETKGQFLQISDSSVGRIKK
ncbi:facilitated trehalose transporter Tret1-like isoform X2 [Ceratina calcarata]|nr:facilitated trehalose transporter Tret1-like isoform X2 [Ceratina calcarata]